MTYPFEHRHTSSSHWSQVLHKMDQLLHTQSTSLGTAGLMILGCLGLSGHATAQGAGVSQMPSRAPIMNTYRDPQIAVEEELTSARKAKTVEAYDLFIARHGDNALAEVARREKAALLQNRK